MLDHIAIIPDGSRRFAEKNSLTLPEAYEKGFDKATGDVLVEIDSRYYRPTEVETLLGDPSKAKKDLGWQHTVSFEELVSEMVQADIKATQNTITV